MHDRVWRLKKSIDRFDIWQGCIWRHWKFISAWRFFSVIERVGSGAGSCKCIFNSLERVLLYEQLLLTQQLRGHEFQNAYVRGSVSDSACTFQEYSFASFILLSAFSPLEELCEIDFIRCVEDIFVLYHSFKAVQSSLHSSAVASSFRHDQLLAFHYQFTIDSYHLHHNHLSNEPSLVSYPWICDQPRASERFRTCRYDPLFCLRDNDRYGKECLVRWFFIRWGRCEPREPCRSNWKFFNSCLIVIKQ